MRGGFVLRVRRRDLVNSQWLPELGLSESLSWTSASKDGRQLTRVSRKLITAVGKLALSH